MSIDEMAERTHHAAIQAQWRLLPPAAPELLGTTSQRPDNGARRRSPHSLARPINAAEVDIDRLLETAERLLKGRWPVFSLERLDVLADVDYYQDPKTGLRAPQSASAFSIDHRNEKEIGNVKFVWELARHQHLTVLALAFALTNDKRFALRIDSELRLFWLATPPFHGIHWTSGIELALRLISWVWIRRLLADWPHAHQLFEDNPVFLDQLGRHQQWLNTFISPGSSANNHLIAEAAGQYVASTGFPVFLDSANWAAKSRTTLLTQMRTQTFSDGLNKELASEYHGFVLELALAPFMEGLLAGDEKMLEISEPMQAAFSALDSIVDVQGNPHRHGDADDAHGILFDPPDYDRWSSLRATGRFLFHPTEPQWVTVSGNKNGAPLLASDLRTAIVRACTDSQQSFQHTSRRSNTLESRRSFFPNAGLTLLRDLNPSTEEIWCMFDHGPLGFLSTAAHGHADALAIELRIGGVEIWADPGTYCYHGERAWRDYFRSTAAHNTIEVGGQNQSTIDGPFLWSQHACSQLVTVAGLDAGRIAEATAEHDGYAHLGAAHRRSVSLDRELRILRLTDTIRLESPTTIRMFFHLGPEVNAALDNNVAELTWSDPAGTLRSGRTSLPHRLSWQLSHGQEEPLMGWYSPRFGERTPTFTLVGTGMLDGVTELTTRFELDTSPGLQ